MKKSEIFSELPLANVPENSIIGAVPERRGRNRVTKEKAKARETFGKIEGIGDVLSDGPRKFLGSLFTENRTDNLEINEEFDPG
ncbi:hypothetical protein, partial [Fibrobacter sp. UBA4297]